MGFAFVLAACLAACGNQDQACDAGVDSGADLSIAPPVVPAALQVPESGDVVILRAPAHGVQIYKCTAVGPPDGGSGDGGAAFAWVFSAPDATLFDDLMNPIGHHYAGPTWELTDGSKVVGLVQAKAASPDAGAIPWLLLKAASSSGTGLLGGARYIQRVDTAGGIAPVTGCDASTPGAEARIDYSAVYYFWGSP